MTDEQRPPGPGRLRAFARRVWRDPRCARWGPVAAGLLGGAGGFAAAGPAAAGVLAAYGITGFLLARGVAGRRAEQRAYRLAADAVSGLAADLRAGQGLAPAWRTAQVALSQAQSLLLPSWRRPHRAAVTGDGEPAADGQPTGAMKATGRPVSVGAGMPATEVPSAAGVVEAVVERIVAAIVLADVSGAPLADLLERLDAHLRAVDRARSVANSQAAGARASAALLGAMPVAGAGLGVVIGVDAVHVLLHTPLGAAALGLAVTLQLGGLAWTARLARAEVTP
jgi:tight adherence protein B